MGEYLRDTINSVDHIYDADLHEVIIVDDGSTDKNTLEILDEIKHHRVINQKNRGLANARNAGILNARAPYLLFLDADNLLTNGYLTKGVEVLNNNEEIDIVYGESEKFGNETGRLNTQAFNLQLLMSYNYIDACCLVRKNVFNDLGGFDENMPTPGYEDWEMWLRAAFNGKKFYYLSGVVTQKYRVRSDSMIREVSRKKRDLVFTYLENKYPSHLSFSGISNFFYQKFDNQTLGWTAKLYIKKYFPALFENLVKKGRLSEFL